MDDALMRQGEDGFGMDIVAASLRADAGDSRMFLDALAVKLEGGLPTQTRVERARDGLLKSGTHVRRITVELAGWRYTLAATKDGTPQATRSKSVGGVVIKTEPLSVEQWIDTLAQDLVAHAQESASVRAALQRLVT